MVRRTFALLAVTALAVSGCAAFETGVDEIEVTATDLPDGSGDGSSPQDPDGTEGGGGGSTEGGGGNGSAGGDGDGSGDGGSDGGEDGGAAASTPIDDLGGVGANGRAYLRGDRARLIVEVDVQEGAQLDQSALDHLASVIDRVADKGDGIAFSGGNTFASDRREWDRAALRDAASANRQHFSDGSTATMYLLVVRGGFHRDGEETTAIGVAYNASEMAVFPDRWEGLGSVLGSSSAIARAVLVHEFGHLLGLVNLTYESDIDHEDPEHPGHSSNQDSVMYYAIETTLIGQVFNGPPPDEFDQADLADIEGLRTGNY